MLTLHHLHLSQSERILFLLEELSLPYTLVTHDRNPDTALAPPALVALHPAGTAPILIDELPSGQTVTLGESAAIVEYIITVHGSGRLARHPGDADYARYLEWWHFANGTLQAHISRNGLLGRVPGAEGSAVVGFVKSRLERVLRMLDDRLGKSRYLAGEELSAADVMSVFSLTTGRGFGPVDLSA